MWPPPILYDKEWQQRRHAQLIHKPTRLELVPFVLVLRTSKRFLLIRWPSHDLGFAKHSPKSKLFIKTGNKFIAFPKFTVTNDKFIAFPKFTNIWLWFRTFGILSIFKFWGFICTLPGILNGISSEMAAEESYNTSDRKSNSSLKSGFAAFYQLSLQQAAARTLDCLCQPFHAYSVQLSNRCFQLLLCFY